MAGDVWYYSVDGAQNGPVNAARLKELATAGQLQQTDLVWKEGAPNWVAASTVKGLFPAANILGMDEANAPPPQEPRTRGSEFSGQAKAAGQDAVAAIGILASNPVGGIGEAHDKLGPQRAMLVGIVLFLVFYLCVFLSIFGSVTLAVWTPFAGFGFDWPVIWRTMILGLVPPLGLILGCLVVRKAFGKSGTIGSDVFISGAVLLPIAVLIIFMMARTPLTKAMPELPLTANVFGMVCAVLMLNSGVTKIYQVSERVSVLAVPIMIAIALSCVSLLTRMLSPDDLNRALNALRGMGL